VFGHQTDLEREALPAEAILLQFASESIMTYEFMAI